MSHRLRCRPPPYPVRRPSCPITRWQGTTTPTGLLPFEDQRLFGWCTSDRDDPGARWRFELESIAGATRLRFLVHLGPGPSGITMVIDSMPEKEGRILHRRLGEHHANMQRVVDGIKAAAESM